MGGATLVGDAAVRPEGVPRAQDDEEAERVESPAAAAAECGEAESLPDPSAHIAAKQREGREGNG